MSTISKISHRAIFDFIHETTNDEDTFFSVPIPQQFTGGLSLLENFSLMSFIKAFGLSSIFEFGTYMGGTTTMIARNTPHETRIVTLDLDPEHIQQTTSVDYDLNAKSQNDDYLRANFREQKARFIERSDHRVKSKITQLFGDSRVLNIDANDLKGKFDLVFIDGGHDLDIVTSDTQKALEMTQEDSLIIWHDYASTIHTDVTDFLDHHCTLAPIYHINHTFFAVHGRGKYARLLEMLSEGVRL